MKYAKNCFPVIKKQSYDEVTTLAVNALFNDECDRFSAAEKSGYLFILLSNILRCTELIKKDSSDNDTVKEIIQYCYDNYCDKITLDDMASALHISKYYISRIFSQLGTDFSGYINSLRIAKACELLKDGALNSSQIAYEVGFGSLRSFNRPFLKIKGIPPREYKTK